MRLCSTIGGTLSAGIPRTIVVVAVVVEPINRIVRYPSRRQSIAVEGRHYCCTRIGINVSLNRLDPGIRHRQVVRPHPKVRRLVGVVDVVAKFAVVEVQSETSLFPDIEPGFAGIEPEITAISIDPKGGVRPVTLADFKSGIDLGFVLVQAVVFAEFCRLVGYIDDAELQGARRCSQFRSSEFLRTGGST